MAGTVAVQDPVSVEEMRARYAALRRKHLHADMPAYVKVETVRPAVQVDAFVPPPALTPNDIIAGEKFTGRACIRLVSYMTGVSMVDLCSHRRSRRLIEARQIYYWMARRFTLLSFPQIARICGDRDHTTALHGCRIVDRNVAAAGVELSDDPVVMCQRLMDERGGMR